MKHDDGYEDIGTSEATMSKQCHICDANLPGGDSPWSICFDPKWKENVWGGDTHEYRAILCQQCAERIVLKKANSFAESVGL